LPGWPRFARIVERADLSCSAADVFWLFGGGTLGLVVLLGLAGASAVTLVLLVIVLVVGLHIWLAVRAQRRRRRFEEQLPELLTEIGSALRAGHGFNQAMIAVTSEAPEPTRKEFERVINETRLGRPLDDALADLGQRIESDDLDFVIDSIVVQRQVGGSLAGIFDIVAESVRQRQKYALRVRSLTAMGRMSALTMLVLPPAIALLLSVLNHGYLLPLFHNGVGRFLVGMSIVLLALGGVWLHKLVTTAAS
jgi:tight adherence protein B